MIGPHARASRGRDDQAAAGPAPRGAHVHVCGDPRFPLDAAGSAGADRCRADRRARERLGRLGKYMIWELDDDRHLLVHLRMTGSLLMDADPESALHAGALRARRRPRAHLRRSPPLRHRPSDALDRRSRRVSEGPARSGAVHARVHRRIPARPGTGSLGAGQGVHPRPAAHRRRRATSTPTRRFTARGCTHCARPGSLTLAQWRAVKDAIEVALAAGIDAKGASIDDFRHVDGARGSFQDRFLVHTRAGEPCLPAATQSASWSSAAAAPTSARRASRGPRAPCRVSLSSRRRHALTASSVCGQSESERRTRPDRLNVRVDLVGQRLQRVRILLLERADGCLQVLCQPALGGDVAR